MRLAPAPACYLALAAAMGCGAQQHPSAAPICGDGLVRIAAEACDDGNDDPLDGCSASCDIEPGWTCQQGATGTSECARIPDAPVVEGEPSAGHFNLLWRWNQPPGTATFQYQPSEAAGYQEVDVSVTSVTHQVSQPGPVTLRVRACNAHGACSATTTFTTSVELFGASNPPAWQGVARSLAQSPLGNMVGVSCHNCYNGPNNEVFNLAEANHKINTALSHGADLIEVDVAETSGVLYASHDDPAAPGTPTFAELLANPTLSASDAMLFLEVKRVSVDPAAFATLVLDTLDAHRTYARNGRPLFLRAVVQRLAYLTALRDALDHYPFMAPYVRFLVLYPPSGLEPEPYTSIDNHVVANGFHGVEFQYQSANLFPALMYARSLGLMTGVWTIPGALGEVFVAALREDVDQITMEYRVDQGRQAISEATTAAYLNARDTSTDELAVQQNLGTYLNKRITLGLAAGGSPPHGTPTLETRPRSAATSLFGGTLRFDPTNNEAIELWDVDAKPGEGFLVTAVVNFDDLDLSNNPSPTMAVLNKSQAGGFALELFYDGVQTHLRFGVHVDGAYVYHSYPVVGAAGDAGTWTQPITTASSYLLQGVYDGDGGVYLFINNRRASTPPPMASGGVTKNGVSIFVGAEPVDAGASHSYFDGVIQQASVQRWGDHTFTGSLIN